MENLLKELEKIKIREQRSDIKIGVIAGGISAEREISLITGKNIFDSLLRSGYQVIFIDSKSKNFISELESINLAFLALHGRFGEDGTIQGLLEILKIPYTGSGLLSSAMVIDKILTKKIFNWHHITTPDFLEINYDRNISIAEIDALIRQNMDYPVVAKPNREGSTIGINLILEASKLENSLLEAFRHDEKVLIEKYIAGRELTVSIIGETPIYVLPIIEIKPKSGFYDYYSKYTKNVTEYIVPAKLSKELSSEIKNIALECHRVMNCSGVSRVDFILDSRSKPFVLEINTMPGMTETSLVPKAAAAAGINFDLLVEIILNNANLKI